MNPTTPKSDVEERILTMVHAFSDEDRKNRVRQIHAEVVAIQSQNERLATALQDVLGEYVEHIQDMGVALHGVKVIEEAKAVLAEVEK